MLLSLLLLLFLLSFEPVGAVGLGLGVAPVSIIGTSGIYVSLTIILIGSSSQI